MDMRKNRCCADVVFIRVVCIYAVRSVFFLGKLVDLLACAMALDAITP